MPPKLSRKEQNELDELLGDIYRGIETLPSSRQTSATGGAYLIAPDQREASSRAAANKSPRIIDSRSYVREYELPSSSPLVKQHKQEVERLRAQHNNTNQQQAAYNPAATSDFDYRQQQQHQQQQQQPQRSNLKRSTTAAARTSNTPDPHQVRQQPQSLASFLATAPSPAPTPENKRRVRIVDHPDRQQASGYEQTNFDTHQDSNSGGNFCTSEQGRQKKSKQQQQQPNKREQVKYVNTNKFIYHQEDEPEPPYAGRFDSVYKREPRPDDSDSDQEHVRKGDDDDDDDENENDVDGVTRVEYYHTSWLDRQLGRASKRRSSKELNERQVKEKAMIEELKRSLKNGAITLRQSFKGNKANKHQHSNTDDFLDDHAASRNHHHHHNNKSSESKVFGSGLATLPRNHPKFNGYNKANYSDSKNSSTKTHYKSSTLTAPTTRTASKSSYDHWIEQQRDKTGHRSKSPKATPKQTVEQTKQQQQQPPPPTTTRQHNDTKIMQSSYSSCTLPTKRSEHQMIQSHYRGQLGSKSPTSMGGAGRQPANADVRQQQQQQQQSISPSLGSSNPYCGPSANVPSMYSNYGTAPRRSPSLGHQQDQQAYKPRRQPANETIGNVPSATEVVRSALSRSGSQVSLNQLNKTINLLPQSPPAPSPMTPTQQLRAASPSLSPSPSPGLTGYQPPVCDHTSRHQTKPQDSIVLHGTRTLPAATRSPISQPQRQQPVYTNPHASLMQHRVEQQMKQPASSRNAASIREFNELDSLLRSLSAASTGGMSTATRQTNNLTPITTPAPHTNSTQVTPGYMSRPAQPTFGGYMSARQPPATGGYTPTNASDVYARVQKPASNISDHTTPTTTTHQPYTIDVTNKKLDENACLQKQSQDISEFEPPIDLLPSMEDYQNIEKLNPVKNHYWYKPNMSRDRAISLLKDKPQGTFIVRDSTSFRGAFGLAVKVTKLPKNVLRNFNGGDPSAEYIRHFLIEPVGNGVRLKGYGNEPVFDSLPDLIYQHSLTELALPCRLVIPRADIEDPRFNYKQKQFYDEFIASKEQAKHAPYERTSPDGGYRRYPGDVLVHNEHRIIFE